MNNNNKENWLLGSMKLNFKIPKIKLFKIIKFNLLNFNNCHVMVHAGHLGFIASKCFSLGWLQAVARSPENSVPISKLCKQIEARIITHWEKGREDPWKSERAPAQRHALPPRKCSQIKAGDLLKSAQEQILS